MTTPLTITYKNPGELKQYAANAREHPAEQIAKLAESIRQFGFIIPVITTADGVLIAGHGRVEAAIAAGLAQIPTVAIDHLTEAQQRAFRLADNRIAESATWDNDLLRHELSALKDAGIDLGLTGFGEDELTSILDTPTSPKARSLAERFLVPPFSVLDARQSYWQQRKAEWLSLGIESECGRGENLLEFSATCNAQGPSRKGRLTYAAGTRTDGLDPTTAKILESGSGTSIFDPVLTEALIRWFAPPGGLVVDPFAGGSVRGLVASRLGRRYTGIELRPEQIAANREQADKIVRPDDPTPEWIEGDSTNIQTLVPAGTIADFILTCPPYADLEVYSDDPSDLSNMPFEQFADSYRKIISNTAALLADDRFAAIVIGDVRDDQGFYRDLVGLTVDACAAAGLKLYNMGILITALGSLPIRTGTQFAKSRKLGKTHQEVVITFKGDIDAFKQSWALKPHHANVAIFAKGSPKLATERIGEVEVGPLEQPEPDTEAA